MVQIKPEASVKAISFTDLYIPHGSDKTISKITGSEFTKNFISHMVQIKLFDIFKIVLAISYFISHMVQIKQEVS